MNDAGFAAATMCVLGLAVVLELSGVAGFEPYPLLHLDAGPADLLGAARPCLRDGGAVRVAPSWCVASR